MATPTLSGRAEVGKFYLVPCIKVPTSARTMWMDVNGWVPIIGPKHSDLEHLEFELQHYHIDWRFVGWSQWRYATQKPSGSPLGSVLTNTHGTAYRPKVEGEPQLRRIKCKRPMPEFPRASTISSKREHAIKWQRMERAQAFVCNKLKPGNICPHRGIDLTPFIKEDGTVICPGHGLRWDTKTGDLLAHHARVA